MRKEDLGNRGKSIRSRWRLQVLLELVSSSRLRIALKKYHLDFSFKVFGDFGLLASLLLVASDLNTNRGFSKGHVEAVFLLALGLGCIFLCKWAVDIAKAPFKGGPIGKAWACCPRTQRRCTNVKLWALAMAARATMELAQNGPCRYNITVSKRGQVRRKDHATKLVLLNSCGFHELPTVHPIPPRPLWTPGKLSTTLIVFEMVNRISRFQIFSFIC